MLSRAILGALVAAAVAFAARRIGSLSLSGAIAATIAGACAIAAGWSWGIILLAFFIVSTALSRLGDAKKGEIVGAVMGKGGTRDASQAIANGGISVAAAIAFLVSASPVWYAVGIGALAASAADTWATEVGTLAGGAPILITTGERVPPGTSGGITLLGTLAGIAGALFMAAAALAAGWPVLFLATAAGGVAGMFVDSILGATLQARRLCEPCGRFTERAVHGCGTPTKHAGGIKGFDNDAVNLVCSGVGGLIALALS